MFSAGVYAGQNHYDPSGHIRDKNLNSKQFQKAFEKHYKHNKSKKQWHDKKRIDGLQPIATAIDYSTRNLYIFNYEIDELITITQSEIEGWKWNLPLQHTAVSADGKHMWVTSDATASEPPRIIRLGLKKLDWNANKVQAIVETVLEVGAPGEPSTFTPAQAVPGSTQNAPAWIQPAMTQVHAITFLPFSKYMYLTEYPTDKVHVVKNKAHESVLKHTIQIDGWTEQTHGIMFNSSGSLGLGTGYFFDNNLVDVYKPNRVTGELQTIGQIPLTMEGPNGENLTAAMTHLVSWIDERYAVTASMQWDKTSLTPPEIDGIVPPSIWLIDAVDMTATKIIDQSVYMGGALRSISDVAVVNNKLYIAEEDSIDFEFGRDGYITVFDITDRHNPVFIKQLQPGVDLPQGYNIAHTLSRTKDNRFVLVASWHAGYLLKLDTYDDTISHVWGPADNIVMPHGLMTAGSLR